MEVAMELEDDLFFADLSKQISLLIMDDNEDPVASCSSVSFQAYSVGNTNYPSPYMYEQNCRRESKGTGVFIPQSSLPRRKHKQGRYNTPFIAKSHRQQQQDNKRMVSQAPNYNNSFISKKG